MTGYQYKGKLHDASLPPASPKCGTRAGYMEHSRRGTEKCQHCKDAQNCYMRDYRRRPKMRTVCGTYAGYMRHKRTEGQACGMCLAAYAAYMQQYRARKAVSA